MWKNFFGKKAKIIGIDLNPDSKRFEKYGFKIFIGDQSKESFWKNFFKKVGKVDIVLDDGGHTNYQQIITTNCCIPNIKDNIAKISFPRKSIKIAVVMRTKETSK